jgi:hypothetical protein
VPLEAPVPEPDVDLDPEPELELAVPVELEPLDAPVIPVVEAPELEVELVELCPPQATSHETSTAVASVRMETPPKMRSLAETHSLECSSGRPKCVQSSRAPVARRFAYGTAA